MPKRSTPARLPQPAFLANAQALYGQAFDHKTQKAIARSMSDWSELEEDEQSFTHAHLLFLNLPAQAATQRLLVQVRDLLDEVAESLTVALEASLVEEPRDDEDDDHGDEDGFFEAPVDAEPAFFDATPGDEVDAPQDAERDAGGEE